MSRSIHETTKQLQKENPTRGEVDALTNDDPTLKRLHQKSEIKKDVKNSRALMKFFLKLKNSFISND